MGRSTGSAGRDPPGADCAVVSARLGTTIGRLLSPYCVICAESRLPSGARSAGDNSVDHLGVSATIPRAGSVDGRATFGFDLFLRGHHMLWFIGPPTPRGWGWRCPGETRSIVVDHAAGPHLLGLTRESRRLDRPQEVPPSAGRLGKGCRRLAAPGLLLCSDPRSRLRDPRALTRALTPLIRLLLLLPRQACSRFPGRRASRSLWSSPP